MSADNLDHADLSAALAGGLVRESVMEKIWLIDQFELPVFDMAARDTTGNRYHEWTIDELGAPANPGSNAKVDGQDMADNDESIGNREGAHCQISTKQVNVSHRSNQSQSIGRVGSLAYQIMRAQQRLRRDVEAQLNSDVASVEDDGDTIAGVTAGFFSWVKTNTLAGATGADGGFNNATKLTEAPTLGTPEALTETRIRDVAQAVYEQGGMTRYLCARPPVIRKLSEYLMGNASARVATQYNPDQGTERGQSSRAWGSVTVFVTDFGQILRMISNRLHPLANAGANANHSHMAFIDPDGIRISFLQGFQTRPLGRLGLSERRIVSVDYCLAVTNEKMQGAIRDIDETAAVGA